MKLEEKPGRSALKRISEQGDEKALKELFDFFYGKLIEIARFYTNDHYAAQDVVSEVFIKLWKNRSQLDKIENIRSYLYVATKRQSLNHIRDSRKRNHYPLEAKDVDIMIETKSPDKEFLAKEFAEVLTNAIQDLPSKCRIVYSLVKDDGMKYREVAEILNVSVKTVEMHVGKALKRIKTAFDNYLK